jgi:hypothetical protein
VWTGADAVSLLATDDTLSGRGSIPGFELPVREIFDAARRGTVDLNLVQRCLAGRGEER